MFFWKKSYNIWIFEDLLLYTLLTYSTYSLLSYIAPFLRRLEKTRDVCYFRFSFFSTMIVKIPFPCITLWLFSGESKRQKEEGHVRATRYIVLLYICIFLPFYIISHFVEERSFFWVSMAFLLKIFFMTAYNMCYFFPRVWKNEEGLSFIKRLLCGGIMNNMYIE